MLAPCASCAELVTDGTCVCPHCGGKACRGRKLGGAAVLLGLTLAACGGKGDTGDTGDTGFTPTGTVQPPYGVPTTGTMSTDVAPDDDEDEESE